MLHLYHWPTLYSNEWLRRKSLCCVSCFQPVFLFLKLPRKKGLGCFRSAASAEVGKHQMLLVLQWGHSGQPRPEGGITWSHLFNKNVILWNSISVVGRLQLAPVIPCIQGLCNPLPFSDLPLTNRKSQHCGDDTSVIRWNAACILHQTLPLTGFDEASFYVGGLMWWEAKGSSSQQPCGYQDPQSTWQVELNTANSHINELGNRCFPN